MVKRQFPNPIELAELMKFKKPTMNATDRRLEKALTIADLRTIAQRRTPKAPFDYTEGSAEGEISLKRARQAFEDVEFHPSILRNVPVVDTTTTVLGGQSSMPFGIAPTGFTRMMQTEGETAGAGAAGAAGIPFTLSTLGTTSIEDVKAANPTGRNWFQLYVMKDREVSYNLVRRAAEAGFDTLFFTVDTPVAGARHRDKRNGFSIPPQLTPGTVINALPRPAWWINFLTTPKLEFASLSSTGGTVGELLNDAMDPTISFDDLAIIRSMWPGKLVVKGVQTVDDAKLLADLGVDGVVLSNHGGRQLDRAPIPFHLLPSVAREVGNDMEVQIDTGIMNGADIVASIALGADFTLIGRAYLYGLMAGGRRGVDKTISILRTEIERTMKLLEVSTLAELGPQHVTQLARLAPIPRTVADAAAATAESKPRTVRTPKAAPAAKTAPAAKAPTKTAPAKAAAKTAPTSAPAQAVPAVKAVPAAKAAPAKKAASAKAAAPKAAAAKKAPAKTAAAKTAAATTKTPATRSAASAAPAASAE